MSKRLFVSGALINGATIKLHADTARYLGKVLRARIGDDVNVFNGDGTEYSAHVQKISKSEVLLRIGAAKESATESPLKIHLVQGVSRSERMDYAVQKATELGVKRITPVLTEYGVIRLDKIRAEKRRDHWQKIATSACEQSGRTRLPLIDTPVRLKEWFGDTPKSADLELILKPGAEIPLTAIAAPKTKVCVMVGPEGGFSELEYEDAAARNFQAVSIGPRTLRTETAAVAALSIMQSYWGDLGY